MHQALIRLGEQTHPNLSPAGILLMEYCAGRDLRSALGLTAADSNERIFGWCAELGRQACCAVGGAATAVAAPQRPKSVDRWPPSNLMVCRYRRGRRVVSEIAKALNFLHARGVVHMDVKSNNVLLTSVRGGRACVPLGSWGTHTNRRLVPSKR